MHLPSRNVQTAPIDAFDIHTATAAFGVDPEDRDNTIPSLDELLWIPTPAFPTALPVGLPPKQSFQALVLTGVRYVVVVGHDLRVESCKSRFQIATSERFHRTLARSPRSPSTSPAQYPRAP